MTPSNSMSPPCLQKTATAVAYCTRGNGLLRVNGRPIENIEPKVLQYKLQEPVLLLGKEKFAGVNIRVRVSGGGHVAQIYAIRQAISKALVSFYQKCKLRANFLLSLFSIGVLVVNSGQYSFTIVAGRLTEFLLPTKLDENRSKLWVQKVNKSFYR